MCVIFINAALLSCAGVAGTDEAAGGFSESANAVAAEEDLFTSFGGAGATPFYLFIYF